jgi:Phosphodiester glycosidase
MHRSSEGLELKRRGLCLLVLASSCLLSPNYRVNACSFGANNALALTQSYCGKVESHQISRSISINNLHCSTQPIEISASVPGFFAGTGHLPQASQVSGVGDSSGGVDNCARSVAGMTLVAGSPIWPSRESASVKFQPPELIMVSDDGLRIDRQRWIFGRISGFAWRAHTPLPGQVRVIPSDHVNSLDQFLPKGEGSWAIINGGFYDVDGKAMGVVVADGKLNAPFRLGGGSGIFEVTKHGPRIIHRSTYVPGASQALQSIDRIIAQGKSLVNRRTEARATARSAVAITDDELFFIVLAQDESIVGRGDNVQLSFTSRYGLPLWAFSEYILKSTAANAALNLDGSISTQFAAHIGDREIRVRGLGGTINALVMRPN